MIDQKSSNSENLLCGTCGGFLKEIDRKLVCETCESFFGDSGVISKCHNCENKFAHFPGIDERVFIKLPSGAPVLSLEERKLWRAACPTCRKSLIVSKSIGGELTNEETTKEIIRVLINSRFVTIRDLEIKGIPREFIKYCIGKEK